MKRRKPTNQKHVGQFNIKMITTTVTTTVTTISYYLFSCLTTVLLIGKMPFLLTNQE